MRPDQAVLHLMLAVVFSACGKTDVSAYTQGHPTGGIVQQNDAEAGDDDPNVPTPPLEERIAAASNGALTCQYNQECLPAVAMISVVVKKKTERCTGFLIAPDLVMTNDHCVSHSSAVKEYGGNCNNLIFAHFAAAGGGSQAQSISCSRIVVRSNQTGLASKDYAVIQLQKPVTDRSALRVAKRGFNQGEAATIYRIQMTDNAFSGTHDGVQVKTVCQTTYGTMVYPALQSSRAPLVTFGDCPIQPGNSGSPALNQDGAVGAIIQGYLEPPNDAKLKDQLQSLLLDQHYGEVGIGTHLACMQEIAGPSSSCTAIPQPYTRYPKAYVAQAGEFDVGILPALGSNERWKPLAAPSADQRLYLRTPTCVGARDSSFQSTVMLYKRGINRFLTPEWRSIFRNGQKTVVFQARSPGGSSVEFTNGEFGSLTIPACGRLTQR